MDDEKKGVAMQEGTGTRYRRAWF